MDNDNITKYYSSIDNDILNKLSKNTNIKNLINLSTYSDINIFDNKKNKYKLKSKKRILKECEIKKKEILNIANLAKLNNNTENNNIKNNTENNNIKNINKIISYLNNDKYIECYSNE